MTLTDVDRLNNSFVGAFWDVPGRTLG